MARWRGSDTPTNYARREPFLERLQLTRTVTLLATFAGAAVLPGAAAAQSDLPPGPPLTSGSGGTVVLHCNALGLEGFVGAIVINRNGEFGSCRFVPRASHSRRGYAPAREPSRPGGARTTQQIALGELGSEFT